MPAAGLVNSSTSTTRVLPLRTTRLTLFERFDAGLDFGDHAAREIVPIGDQRPHHAASAWNELCWRVEHAVNVRGGIISRRLAASELAIEPGKTSALMLWCCCRDPGPPGDH